MKYFGTILLLAFVIIIIIVAISKGITGSEYIAIALVAITAYYAYQTYINNQIMKESINISFRPYFAFMGISSEEYCFDKEKQNIVCIQLSIELMNVGKVPLKYTMKKVDISIDKTKNKNPLYYNQGSYVFPSQKTTYFCELTPEIDKNNLPLTGMLEYELEYNSTIDCDKSYKSSKKIKYTLFHKKIVWYFLHEKEE